MPTEDINEKIANLSAWVTAAIAFCLVVVVTLTAVVVWQVVTLNGETARIQEDAVESHLALCEFKFDLQGRYDRGLEFQKAHPAGLLDSRGAVLISKEDLQRSLDGQKSTLEALAPLTCDTNKESDVE